MILLIISFRVYIETERYNHFIFLSNRNKIQKKQTKRKDTKKSKNAQNYQDVYVSHYIVPTNSRKSKLSKQTNTKQNKELELQ